MAIDPRLNTTIDPWNIGIGSGGVLASNISNTSWVKPTDYSIQGKMFSVNLVISDWEMSNRPLQPEEIKYRLANEMVKKMTEEGFMEFTKMLDPTTFEHRFHARIFVVPDTQVRILRENNIAKVGPW